MGNWAEDIERLRRAQKAERLRAEEDARREAEERARAHQELLRRKFERNQKMLNLLGADAVLQRFNAQVLKNKGEYYGDDQFVDWGHEEKVAMDAYVWFPDEYATSFKAVVWQKTSPGVLMVESGISLRDESRVVCGVLLAKGFGKSVGDMFVSLSRHQPGHGIVDPYRGTVEFRELRFTVTPEFTIFPDPKSEGGRIGPVEDVGNLISVFIPQAYVAVFK